MTELGLAATNSIRCQRRPVARPCRASLRPRGLGVEVICRCGRVFPTSYSKRSHARHSPQCILSAEERKQRARDAAERKRRARGAPIRQAFPTSFWSRVDRQGKGCWLWLGHRTPRGYGTFTHRGQDGRYRPVRAHRLAWMLVNGPIPPGLLVCHRCDNPPCCRPDHLFLGTASDNVADMTSKGRNRWGHTPRYGQANPASKLSEDQVLEIRRRRAAGELLTVLAAEYRVTITTISRVARGMNYRRVKS